MTVNNSAPITLAKERAKPATTTASLFPCGACRLLLAKPALPGCRRVSEATWESGGFRRRRSVRLWWRGPVLGDRALGPPIGRQASWGEPEGVQGMAKGGCAPSAAPAVASGRQDSPHLSSRPLRAPASSPFSPASQPDSSPDVTAITSDPHDPSCQECRNATPNLARGAEDPEACVRRCSGAEGRCVWGWAAVLIGARDVTLGGDQRVGGAGLAHWATLLAGLRPPLPLGTLPLPSRARGLIERALTRLAFTPRSPTLQLQSRSRTRHNSRARRDIRN